MKQTVKDGPYHLAVQVAKQKGDKKASYQNNWARSTEQDYPYIKTFADEQAARLEEPKFLHWVNNLRNQKKRAAQAVSAVSKGRLDRRRLEAGMQLCSGSKAVKALLAVAGCLQAPDEAAAAREQLQSLGVTDTHLDAWSQRQSTYAMIIERGAAGVSGVTDDAWIPSPNLGRSGKSRSPKTAAAPRVRGPSRANLVSLFKARAAPADRHASRVEKRAAALLNRSSLLLDHDTRVARIKQLQGALASTNVSSLLRDCDEAGEISPTQSLRLGKQAMAMISYYQTVDEYEMGASREKGSALSPPQVVNADALAKAASIFGERPATINRWKLDFDAGGCTFAADGRGKWKRDMMCNEEDVKRELLKYMRTEAKEDRLTVESTHKWLNDTLLVKDEYAELLLDYKIRLPIARTTAGVWMRECGAVHGRFKPCYYTDTHEAGPTIKDRQERCVAVSEMRPNRATRPALTPPLSHLQVHSRLGARRAARAAVGPDVQVEIRRAQVEDRAAARANLGRSQRRICRISRRRCRGL